MFVKPSCDNRFQREFTARVCVFTVITLVGSSQYNYFENATACNKRTLPTTVATQGITFKKYTNAKAEIECGNKTSIQRLIRTYMHTYTYAYVHIIDLEKNNLFKVGNGAFYIFIADFFLHKL